MRKIITLLSLVILITSCTGCASFRRKFVRKRKKEEQPRPVVHLKAYSKQGTYDELYRKHFLFWKYWELELIDALGEDNHKKQLLSVSQAIDNLKSLESYLLPEQEALVKPARQKLEEMEGEIRKGFSSGLQRLRMKEKIEKHQRILEKELIYKKMKDFLRSRELENEGENPKQ